jgi:hypothetical protein
MRKGLNAALAIFLTALFLFGAGMAVHASSDGSARGVLLQQATDYPNPDETQIPEYDYPPGDTQVPILPTKSDLTLSAVLTPVESSTPSKNLLATEDAEMRNTLGTQLPSATAGPSITPINTQTVQSTTTGTVIPAVMQNKKNGFKVDWGYFFVGFAVPVLAACGVVLYLLDRRPDLFTPRQKL